MLKKIMMAIVALTTAMSLQAEPYKQLVPDDFKCEYTDKLPADLRLRGVMLPGPDNVNEEFCATGLPVLQEWGANVARYQVCKYWGNKPSFLYRDEYLRWISESLVNFKKFLPEATKAGIKVIFDVHVAPGGRDQYGEMNMFYNEEYVETLIEAWKMIATELKDTDIFAYDIINEPYQTQKAPIDYMEVQYRCALAIREIDPETPIVVDGNINSRPQEFVYMTPLPLKDIIYQFHMYQPDAFTHQGVFMPHAFGTVYPGIINGFYFNKERLRNIMQPVIDFQNKYGARIYVGEFSAIRWAQGGAQFLDDVISLFEEYGWDWSYHAFREWTGWSVEHTGPFNPNPDNPALVDFSIPAIPAANTDRKEVLLKYMKKNLQ